jgi:hypothetical protein
MRLLTLFLAWTKDSWRVQLALLLFLLAALVLALWFVGIIGNEPEVKFESAGVVRSMTFNLSN